MARDPGLRNEADHCGVSPTTNARLHHRSRREKRFAVRPDSTRFRLRRKSHNLLREATFVFVRFPSRDAITASADRPSRQVSATHDSCRRAVIQRLRRVQVQPYVFSDDALASTS